MKNILIPFDGTNYAEQALAYAKWLNTLEKIVLTGVFLPHIDYNNLWNMAVSGPAAGLFVPVLEARDTEIIEENAKRFKSFCTENGIACRVHKDFGDYAVEELKNESRFADLLLIGSEEFYRQLLDKNDQLETALHGAECPVLLVPEHFNIPANNILTYNGGKNSVYAIKQFTYLFPQLLSLPTLLVYGGGDPGDKVPAQFNIEEWVGAHFSDITITSIDTDGSKHFKEWLHNKRHSMLVIGAYGRSDFSRMLRKSFAADIISHHQLPVFISHR